MVSMDRTIFTYDGTGITLTVPTPEGLKTVVLFGLVALAIAVVLVGIRFWQNKPAWMRDLRIHPNTGLNAGAWILLTVFGALYVCVFVVLVGGLIWALSHVPDIIDGALYANDPSEARWLLASLAALTAVTSAAVALPFTILKTIYNRRQTDVAEQSHITDQLNKAVENLGATRDIHRQRLSDDGKRKYFKDSFGNTDFSQPVFETVTVPNLEVRIGGILALERIAKHNLSEHIQVMEILCAFIRENAREFVATTVPLGEDGEVLPGPYIFPRHDIASALSVIARRGHVQRQLEIGREPPYRLNFYQADFRGLEMQGRDFANAILDYAQFEGADLTDTTFERASLSTTNFSESILNRANFRGSYIQFNSFENAELEEANFDGAILGNVNFSGVQRSATCTFLGAACFGIDLRTLGISGNAYKWIFGDASSRFLADQSGETDHWLTEAVTPNFGPQPATEIHISKFMHAWRAWQDEIGFDPLTNTLKGHSD
jgi:uncharacterized protein YjbI with pentapeptide repeats